MKIRNKLTLLFTFITATILQLFASSIFYTAREARETEFFTSLKKEAITKVNLFLNANVDVKTLQDIYHNNRKILDEVEVAIYDTAFNLLYHDALEIDFVKESRQMINDIYEKGEIKFFQEDWQVVGLKYKFENKSYIITAAAYDKHGYSKINSLRNNCILGFIISILFMFLTGRFFSQKAFEPVKQMTDKAKNISATNFDLRLNITGSKDELAELANTFNEMLNRLENSFEAQKQFVSNISHELRTPLSSIIAELEISENKDRSIEEYKSVIKNSLSDARRLAKLSNSLLDFAKASYDTSEIAFKKIRLDEILLDAQQLVSKLNPEYSISIEFENEYLDEEINISGNEYLLKTAFVNLMENACKFSPDKHCDVFIFFQPDTAVIKFSDKGIGISEADLPNIFTPFFRGENKKYVDGNGIGLSLTHKIIALHKGTISISSRSHQGTTFKVTFPT